MAIKPEAAVAGAVLYSRRRHKMGNTTLRTTGEWYVRVIESYDPEKGYAVCSWNGNHPIRYYPRDLKSLHSWSMRDENEAILHKGMWDAVVRVERRKKCASCKKRHAASECPKEET